MKIAILTLGCRTNQAESAHIEEMLLASGHHSVTLSDNADVCIVNTCSVTAKADYQSRQLISRAIKANTEVIVTGCYAELNRDFLKDRNSKLKFVCNKDKYSIINYIDPISSTSQLAISKDRHRPVIKIQDGCNTACSYCIIPRARGNSVSVKPEAVLEEVDRYVEFGFEEVVISGIHLGVYGHDLSPRYNLSELLTLILTKTSIRRMRLSSIELNEITPHLTDIMDDRRICRHLHIPLQSGDDNILTNMNRSYTAYHYRESIERILQRYDNIAIGTDIIVGFPGEADSHFNRTLNLINSLDLSYLHVFPYSRRPGTRAALMPNQVPGSEIKQRVKQLRDIGQVKKAHFMCKNIGAEHEIIVETSNEGGILGTTSNYIKVLIPSDVSMIPGKLVRIGITGTSREYASGGPVINVQPPNK